MLSTPEALWKSPLDGVTFGDGKGLLVAGKDVGLSLDLATLPSPYLEGIMDPFLDNNLRPMVQTSRLCPYTCSFCTSGKNQGKLRVFPKDQIMQEFDFLFKRYANRPSYQFLISDENFGINHQDAEIADFIKECSRKNNYPKSIFYNTDKQFKKTSRKIIKSIGNLSSMGISLSLQSDNPKTLAAIKRKNLSWDEISEIIQWSKTINVTVSSELIFGLPEETLESFTTLLEKASNYGIDQIYCYNLFIMSGIEMNRLSNRTSNDIKTRFRPIGPNHGIVGGIFCAEFEEVVVSSSSFSYEDFLTIRGLNFMFHSIFTFSFYKWFFQYTKHSGVTLVELLSSFISGKASTNPDYIAFINDFYSAAKDELFNTPEQAKEHIQNEFIKNNNQVMMLGKLNVFFAARLLYMESSWLNTVLMEIFTNFMEDNKNAPNDWRANAEFLLDLCANERIIFLENSPSDSPKEITSNFDLAEWMGNRFSKPMERYRLEKPKHIIFSESDMFSESKESFLGKRGHLAPQDVYYNALMFFAPYTELNYTITLRDICIQNDA